MRIVTILFLFITNLLLSQEISVRNFQFDEWEYYIYSTDNLRFKEHDNITQFEVDNVNFSISVHGGMSYTLMEFFNEYRVYKDVENYNNLLSALIFPLYNDTIKNILVKINYSDDNCDCLNSLVESILDNKLIVYGDVTIGDIIMSDRLKYYEICFYNTKNELRLKNEYQHRISIYYKQRMDIFDWLNKTKRKTRTGWYTIVFPLITLNN